MTNEILQWKLISTSASKERLISVAFCVFVIILKKKLFNLYFNTSLKYTYTINWVSVNETILIIF